MKIVSVEQMQAAERAADASGIGYESMMENAGRGVADWVGRSVPHQKGVIGLVGSGNNGGDTVIALTWLARWGVRTIAFLVKKRDMDPLLDDYYAAGGAMVDLSEGYHFDIFQASLIPGVVVLDGILGTGFRLPLRGSLLDVMANIHQHLENRLEGLLIAVDCPSGVDCDTGEVSDVTFKAAHTLTMAAMKKGLLKHPARSFAGDLHFIDIGIGDPAKYIIENLPVMVNKAVLRGMYPERPDEGHKGTFGTCLVIAGSVPYTGAAYLTGKAAYRSGCGLVHMGVLQEVQRALSGALIEAVWTVLPEVEGGFDPHGLNALNGALQSASSIVVGPGWGLNEVHTSFLRGLLAAIPPKTTLLIDADALKELAKLEQWWTLLPEQTVLTPHPGEMSVLTGHKVREIQANRWEIASKYANHWQVTLILKGAMTVIADPDQQIFINPVSDTALATAGSGDVLSGIVGGLMAQGVAPLQASILGVFIHANAGKIARIKQQSDLSVTALDILDCLPEGLIKAKEAGD